MGESRKMKQNQIVWQIGENTRGQKNEEKHAALFVVVEGEGDPLESTRDMEGEGL